MKSGFVVILIIIVLVMVLVVGLVVMNFSFRRGPVGQTTEPTVILTDDIITSSMKDGIMLDDTMGGEQDGEQCKGFSSVELL